MLCTNVCFWCIMKPKLLQTYNIMTNKNDTQIEAAVQCIANTHAGALAEHAGLLAIWRKLLIEGALITTDTVSNLMGFGSMCNFIHDTPCEDGIGVFDWKLDEKFWDSNFIKDLFAARCARLKAEVEELEARILTIDEEISDLYFD